MPRMTGPCGLLAALLALAPFPSTGEPGPPLARIEVIETKGAARRLAPVTIGVPIAKSALVSDASELALVRTGRDGSPIPCQVEPLARWEAPLGETRAPLRFVRVDAVVPLAAHERVRLDLVRGRPAPPPVPLRLERTPEAIVVDAGAARFTFPAERDAFLSGVRTEARDGFAEAIDPSSAGGLRVLAREGGEPHLGASVCPDSVTVDAAGPVRAALTFRTTHRPGTGNAAYPGALDVLETVTRYEAFAGLPLVRVTLTLRNPDRMKAKDIHAGGPDVEHVFEDVTFRLPPERARGDEGDGAEADAVVVYQDSSGGENWGPSPDGSSFHATAFRGFKIFRRPSRQGEPEEIGSDLRFDGVLERPGAGSTAAVFQPEMAENYPKALRASPRGAIDVGLFPGEWSVPHRFRGGLQKTHRFSFAFASRGFERPGQLAAEERDAPFVKLDPSLARDSLAAGLYSIEDGDLFPRHESAIDAILDYRGPLPSREGDVFREIERKDLYGWLDWGDHYRAGSKSSRYFGNNEFDFSSVFLLQDLRSPRIDPRWRRLGAAMARHLADVDVYHTSRDLDWANHGVRKHDASGVIDHRREPSLSHFWVGGLSLQAFLGPDPPALEALLEIGAHLRARERSPRQFAYAGEVRSRGWYLVALADLYDATGDAEYLRIGARAAGALVTGALSADGFLASPEYRAKDAGDVSPWQMGIACEGLGRYALARARRGDRDAEAESSLLRMLAFLRDRVFDAETGLFPYVYDSATRTPRPKSAHLSQVLSDGFAYGYLLSGDPSLLETGRSALEHAIPRHRYPAYFTTTIATAAKNAALNLRPGRPLRYVLQKSDPRRDGAPPRVSVLSVEAGTLRVETDEPCRIAIDAGGRRVAGPAGFLTTHVVALPENRAAVKASLTDLAGNETEIAVGE